MKAIDQSTNKDFTIYHGDCVEVSRILPENSIDYYIFSPPFASLYTYSANDRDMGNSKNHGEFYEHYKFLIAEQLRTLKPGRLLSFHCMNLPTRKAHNGYIGISDFRGKMIRLYEDAGFIYHSEVAIWKDPVAAMQRTKALGLLYKQLRKDSAMSRQGIPDYLVTMRKPGVNPNPINHFAPPTMRTIDENHPATSKKERDEALANPEKIFRVEDWQKFASPVYGDDLPCDVWMPGTLLWRDNENVIADRFPNPVWMDINPSETLQFRSAREHNDERHICPLQLEVIRRGIRLWTNPRDVVGSSFSGIGSEGYVAIQEGRRFVGMELKPSYYKQAVANLTAARNATPQMDLGLDLCDASR